MKKDELIHVKFEHNELLQSKRDLLSLEMSLLKIIGMLKRYHFLRQEELNKKSALHKRIKETNLKIKNLQTVLPKLHVPEILQDKKIKEDAHKELIEIKRTGRDEGLDSQLEEIQNKLRELQG